MFQQPIMVTSIEYYREQDDRSRAENMRYYTDNEKGPRDGESYGVWWTPQGATAAPISSMIENGQAVAWDTIDKISRGIDPATDKSLIKRTKAARYVAIDCTNNAPKPVSVLYGLAKAHEEGGGNLGPVAAKIAAAIEKAHVAANNRSMEYLFEIGGFQTRQGKQGKERAGAANYAAAQFIHYTSRAGDMHLHTHNVIPNIGRREDGKIGALDNYKFNAYRGAASAIYRAELFQILKAEFAELDIQLSVSRDGRNLSIDGVPDELTAQFSKRREAILEEMAKQGYDGTANNVGAAQVASWNTRGKKEDLPPLEVLYNAWRMEANAMGHSFGSLLERVDMTAKKVQRERAEAWEKTKAELKADGHEVPESEFDYRFGQIKANATKAVLETESAFEERKFLTMALEELQEHVGADDALRMYSDVKAEAGLVEIGTKGRAHETVYSTEAVLKMEREILDMAKRMQGNLAPIPHEIVARRLAEGIKKPDGERFMLRDEQEDMVRALTGANQFCVISGDAGTGKTTAMQKVREIADDVNLNTIVCGPTHRSVDVLRQDVGVAPENAYAVAGLIAAYDKGKLTLGKGDLVIVDEAGMIPSKDWHKLETIADKTGARFACVGDYKQLPPVGAGAPMRMVSEFIGETRLQEIARQREPWQREASKAFADTTEDRFADAIRAYDDHGCVVVCDHADDMEAKAVDRFFEHLDGQPGATVVMLATRNDEVARLNLEIRRRKIERGELTGEAVEIEAITRGKNGRRTELSLMVGDRIIIGETVHFGGKGGEKFSNNSFGTVQALRKAEGEEPELTVKWDDGRVLSFKPSQFVGYRDADDAMPTMPKIAIADAMTFYASQGMTAEHCIIATRGQLSREDTYVGYTRHKGTFAAFIDGARHANDLAVEEGKTFHMSKKGATKQEDDEPEKEVTREDIIANYIDECQKATAKKNACDFLGGAKEYYSKLTESQLGNREEETMADDLKEAEGKKTDFRNSKPSFGIGLVRGLGRIGGEVEKTDKPKTLSEEIEGIQKRTYNAKPNKPKRVKAPENLRLSKDEVHTLVQQNLKDYMLSNGATLKNTSRDGKEFTLSFGKGQGCVVKEWPGGNWTFFMRDRSAKGDIRNFVSWRDGVEIGEAMHRLRDEFKTKERHDTAPSHVIDKEARPVESNRQRFDRLLSETYVGEKFAQIRDWWNSGKQAVSAYLAGRGIEKETQARFKDDFRCEGKETFDGKNKGGVMFAMKNADGDLTGFHRKGYKPFPKAKRDLSYNVEGTERHMLVMGDPWKANRVYVGEAPIDGLSLFQRDGRPENSAVLAFAGSAPENGLAQIYKIAKDNPSVEWHYVAQNDEADIVNENKAKEAILEGNPSAKIEARRPPEQFKDWNDELRGKERPVEKTAAPAPANIAEQRKADKEAQARREKREAEKVRIAEQQRKAQEEAQRNKDRGPSMG